MKKADNSNFLEKIPYKNEAYNYSVDNAGVVTLEIENKGVFNRIAQLILKKPKVSYIHLDEFGSFVWNLCDGKSDIINIGKAVEQKFGENANPLYERLSRYIKTLEDYGFIKLHKQ